MNYYTIYEKLLNMLMENEPIDKIARYTGLAKEDILKLN
jgi:hypothetical protein